MYQEKSKRDDYDSDRQMPRKSGMSAVLILLMVVAVAYIWQNHSGGSVAVHGIGDVFDVVFGFIGAVIGTVFGIIGQVFGLVFGLIGQIFGLVFGIIGTVLGLVGGLIGLIFGFIGLVLGLVFGTLGLILSVAVPLALIVLLVKLFSSDNSEKRKHDKRKNDWRDDEIVNI